METHLDIPAIVSRLAPFDYALPLSFTKGSTLFNCPRMYRLRYIEKAKGAEPPEKEVLTVGKFVHKVLELCMNKGQGFGWDPEVIDFDRTWMQVQAQMRLTHQEYLMAQNVRIHSEHVFERLVAAINAYGLTVTPELMFCMDRKGQVRNGVRWPARFFFGYIDFYAETRAGTRAMVIDYKSGRKTEEGAARTNLQLGHYVCNLFVRNPRLRSIQYGGAYLPDEAIDLSDQVVRGSAEHAAIVEAAASFYNRYASLLEAGDFNPTPGKYCSWCGYAQGCPENPNDATT